MRNGRTKRAVAQDVGLECPVNIPESTVNDSKRPAETETDKTGFAADPDYCFSNNAYDTPAVRMYDTMREMTGVIEMFRGMYKEVLRELHKINSRDLKYDRMAELNEGFICSLREGRLDEWLGKNEMAIFEDIEKTRRMGGYVKSMRDRMRVSRINVPDGYRIIRVMRDDGSEDFYRVNSSAMDISLKMIDALQSGGNDWKMMLHPGKSQEEVQKEVRRRPIVTNRGYSADEFDAPDEIDKMLEEQGRTSGLE